MRIPNYGEIMAQTVLFDLNGTLGESGRVDEETKHLLERLADKYTVVVLSADTFGTLGEEFRGLPVRIERVSNGAEKDEIARGYEPYIAVGNGNNDVAMLEGAELAFCVVGPEGATIDALLASDVVVKDVKDAIAMLLDERKLIATLRG
ncbi:HAD family hydrolase [Thermococcus barossii]|uniref:HAD family hydrolase n=1 Tax=Thermococcus barossii TaxID=54077 RepID=A0A2Z2MFF3_9EURY|nr:HAD family hydrolase [Thermococcus barossii]ASJ04646.1 HAD family hydrolase [Thermococcus barossii]